MYRNEKLIILPLGEWVAEAFLLWKLRFLITLTFFLLSSGFCKGFVNTIFLILLRLQTLPSPISSFIRFLALNAKTQFHPLVSSTDVEKLEWEKISSIEMNEWMKRRRRKTCFQFDFSCAVQQHYANLIHVASSAVGFSNFPFSSFFALLSTRSSSS